MNPRLSPAYAPRRPCAGATSSVDHCDHLGLNCGFLRISYFLRFPVLKMLRKDPRA